MLCLAVSVPVPQTPKRRTRAREPERKDFTLDYTPGCRLLKIGLSVDAIRFYERNSLLRRAPRTEGGFRHYGEDDVETLAFIRRVQGLGFKLSEIRGLLDLRGSRLQPCD